LYECHSTSSVGHLKNITRTFWRDHGQRFPEGRGIKKPPREFCALLEAFVFGDLIPRPMRAFNSQPPPSSVQIERGLKMTKSPLRKQLSFTGIAILFALSLSLNLTAASDRDDQPEVRVHFKTIIKGGVQYQLGALLLVFHSVEPAECTNLPTAREVRDFI
jgi:hypothetical protein